MSYLSLWQRKGTPIRRMLFNILTGDAGETLYENTATGNPATFTTDLAKSLVSLSVPFTPIQSGSGDPSPTNVRAISGWTGLNVYRTGKNIFAGEYPDIKPLTALTYHAFYVGEGKFTASTDMPLGHYGNLFILPGNVSDGASTGGNNVNKDIPRTVTASGGYITLAYYGLDYDGYGRNSRDIYKIV